MRRLTLGLVLVVALGHVPVAAAKELVAVEVCGASGCNRAEDEQTLRNVPGASEMEIPLGPPAPFYLVTFVMGEGAGTHESTVYYVPSQNAMAYVDPYESVRGVPIFGPTAKATMRRLTAGLKPYPAPVVTSVAVGDEVLRSVDAVGYLDLYRAGTRVPYREVREWLRIDLRSAAETPWTVGARELMFSPDAEVIERGGVYFEVPDWLAADVEAARPLHKERRLPWGTIGLSLLAAVTLSSLTPILRKKAGRSPV